MIALIVLLVIVGAVIALVPMDPTIRNVIVVVVILYVVAALFGYAPMPPAPRLR